MADSQVSTKYATTHFFPKIVPISSYNYSTLLDPHQECSEEEGRDGLAQAREWYSHI